MSATTLRTQPPGRYVVLYDGHCRFCTAGAKKLLGWMGKVDVELADFQAAGVLDRFPGLTYEMCMERLHLVTPAGQVFAGAEALARAAGTRPVLGKVAYVYFVPGLRQLVDGLYGIIATHRYRLMGRVIAEGKCAGGTCSLHLGKQITTSKRRERRA